MSGKQAWQKVRHELEQVRIALDSAQAAFDSLATSRRTTSKQLRVAQERLAECMAQFEQLNVIERNLRRILGIREVTRVRGKRPDA